MRDKIALVSCSGLSPLGLVVRAATVDLALCVSTILKEKDVKVEKTIDAESIVVGANLNPNDSARLDEQGELAVAELKKAILKELEDL